MPEPRPNPPVIALAMFMSAMVLAAVAAMIYAGVISLGEDLRIVATLAVGAAALADFVVAVWFFRKSQSL
jgi:hypothetical protein